MDKRHWGLALLLGMFAAGIGNAALADRGHGGHHGHARVGVGIVFDPFWFGPGYYPNPYYYPPYYYPPAVVAVPATPPTYIEQEEVPAPSAYWYYCANPPGYYPYVKHCPGGWQPVAPQPPDEGR